MRKKLGEGGDAAAWPQSSRRRELLSNDSKPISPQDGPLTPLWISPATGAWAIHPILILVGKFVFDSIPGIGSDLSWTLVTCGYMAVRPLLLTLPHSHLI